jgi:RNA polymerase sigma factor (sigma-70 family)
MSRFAVYLEIASIIAEAPFIRATLRTFGVRSTDLDDVTQDVLLGAWRSMAAGRFRPAPATPLRSALRAWLTGIAFNLSTHYRERAHRRHEVAAGMPHCLPVDTIPGPEAQIVARDLLRALRRLPPECRAVVALAAVGADAQEIARELAIPANTVMSRLRRARQQFLRALTRWRRLR